MIRLLLFCSTCALVAGCGPRATPRSVSAPARSTGCSSGDETTCRAQAKAACDSDHCADTLLDRWCDDGDANACYTLGFEADHSNPLLVTAPTSDLNENSFTQAPKDSVAARRYDERACELGSLAGCENLGALLAHGRGGEVDWTRAEALFQRACDGGNLRGCAALASVYFDGGPPEKRDESRSAAISAKTCDAGDAVACSNLGFQYVQGRGVERDVPKGIALYERACHGGNGPACMNIADLYTQGTGVPKDDTRATDYLIAACDANNPAMFACGAVGRRIAEGLGITADPKRGLAILERACDTGYAIGCAQLGYYYAHGKVVQTDEPRARTYYTRACKLGHSDSCALP